MTNLARTTGPTPTGEGAAAADAAADFLEGFLDTLDVDGDIETITGGSRLHVTITSDDLPESDLTAEDLLVGPGGETLEALQILLRLAIQRATGERSWAMLDIGGFREQQKNRVREEVESALEAIDDGAHRVPLRPMSPFERKIAHDILGDREDLSSDSVGEGSGRHIVVERL